MSIREKLFRKLEVVEVPLAGCYVKELPYSVWQQMLAIEDSRESNFFGMLHSICEKDGTLALTEADRKELESLPTASVNAICDAIITVNNRGKFEAAVKK